MIQPNMHLLDIYRVREDMDARKDYIMLDRNERVTPLEDSLFQDILSTLTPELFCRYPNPAPLYTRLSRRLNLPEDHLYLTPGSDGALRMIFQTYVRPGDHVAMLQPSYAMYAIYAAIFRAEVLSIPFGTELHMEPAAITQALDKKPRLLVLANPNQPTGTAFPPEVIRRFVERAADQGTLVIIDEAYYPFYPQTIIETVRDFPNMVVVRSFSKAYGLAGLRLGYLAAQPAVVDHIHRVRGAHEINAVAIAIGSYLLDHHELVESFVSSVEAGRRVLARAAEAMGLHIPPCPTNFQLVGYPYGVDIPTLLEALKTHGYLVQGGYEVPCLRDYLRVTLAGPDVMQGFVQALRDVTQEVPT